MTDQINDIEQKDVGDTDNSQQKNKREDVRSQLAIIYVVGFLIVIGLVLIISWTQGFETSSVKDLLLTSSGILSGPLGFIIGYYFKANED